MSEQARKVFNIEEQKAKDVLAAIKTVQPVLSIIREWGVKEQEYKHVSENKKKLSEEISSLKHVIGLTCKGLDLEKDLSEMLETRSSEYEVSLKGEEKLKGICKDLEGEVLLYQEYAKMFTWIDNNVIEEILKLNNFEDKEEFLSMIFLFLNAKVLYYNLEPLHCFIDKEGYHINALTSSNGWNWMLNQLKLNKL